MMGMCHLQSITVKMRTSTVKPCRGVYSLVHNPYGPSNQTVLIANVTTEADSYQDANNHLKRKIAIV